jgi:hypothetical protein
MTIFDYLAQIFVEKRTDVSLEHYVPYMINRWLSFINPTICESINHFNDKSLLENKEMHYKVMLTSFPKLRSVPRIDYEKKSSKKAASDSIDLKKVIAQSLEISEREVENMLNFKKLL